MASPNNKLTRGKFHMLSLMIVVLVWALLLSRLTSVPPLWWDEGWTLTVARTWVEDGLYARKLLGEIAPAGLEASFPITASVTLGFKLFGVGVWQGRLVAGVFHTMVALLLLYSLTKRLFGARIAVGTLFAALLMTPHLATNAIYLGHQVIAEPAMAAWLLLGYHLLYNTLRGRRSQLPLLLFVWGVAVWSKSQVLPFWFLSLFVPLLVALARRQRQIALILGLSLAGGFAASKALPAAVEIALGPRLLKGEPLVGLVRATALVFDSAVRSKALTIVLVAALPVLVGLVWGTWRWVGSLRRHSDTPELVEVVRTAMLWLAGSWCAWYVLLSVGWPRYLFPALFFASPFVSALLSQLSSGFRLGYVLQSAALALRNHKISWNTTQGLAALLLIALTVPLTLQEQIHAFGKDSDRSVYVVADWLNTQTEPNALIETYDSELLFLLDRPYHYPPDETDLKMIASFSNSQLPDYGYDPLIVGADYLVVGPMSGVALIYAGALDNGPYQLVADFDSYQIYALGMR